MKRVKNGAPVAEPSATGTQHDRKLSRRERRARAVELLAFGLPKAEVARRIGCHRHTVHDWMTSGEFIEEVSARCVELREEFRARVLELGLEAVQALKTALHGKANTAQVKAASLILTTIGALEPKPVIETNECVEVAFPVPDWMLDKGPVSEG